MKQVLVVQPSLQPPGGSNGVAAWVVQALTRDHRVTVLTWQPVETGAINRFYGTDLKPSQFETVVVPVSWRAIPDHLPVPAHLIKNALLMRYTHTVSAGFDVIFGVYNETDFGRRGIQYLHYPTYLRPRPAVDLRWYHPRLAVEIYYAIADRIAGFSLERLKSNVTLVNSDWTGERVSRFLGVPTRTLYPPVAEPAPGNRWHDRRADFLAIGRISPEKEYERIIRILARVRDRHPNISLTIVGTSDRHTRRYFESIEQLARSHGSWIQFRDNVSREELRRLIASTRFGIHGMREEHFGMAPAEMARGGMVVWVPSGGGQTEIAEGEPELLYTSDDDAIEKISRTLDDDDAQRRLQEHLTRASERFSTTHFMRQVQDIVATFSA